MTMARTAGSPGIHDQINYWYVHRTEYLSNKKEQTTCIATT